MRDKVAFSTHRSIRRAHHASGSHVEVDH
jgi:hypothetical protein